MKLSYDFNGHREESEFDSSCRMFEAREVFGGFTFVTEAEECLSVIMRDNGFEIHYYSDPERDEATGFDFGWLRLNNGVAEDVCGQPEISTEVKEDSIAQRIVAWNRATEVVDRIIEKTPLEAYRVGAMLGNLGSTVTPSEQYVDLVRGIAAWFMGEDD